ncbi:uncharacterized protein DUF349 [Larkinella arboricola]|uniref:Uncharacterized protein DUF349 n=1 Tax=Larkinella arboricola TaxID=643671 RepID=A0A327X4T0_LARAB|nr:DUF349 domain-containing protein [Larkinella arboricola]RAK00535.1 uncharacterized protein DUF349 [Larkinella arboricola]
MASEEQEITERKDQNPTPSPEVKPDTEPTDAVDSTEETTGQAEEEPTAQPADAVEAATEPEQTQEPAGMVGAEPEPAVEAAGEEPTQTVEAEPVAEAEATSEQPSAVEETTQEPTARVETAPAEPAGEPTADPSVDLEMHQDPSEATETELEEAAPSVDYSQYTKADMVGVLEKLLASLKSETASPADYRRADEVLKEIRPLFDQSKSADRTAALQRYVQETGSDEGFEYRHDDVVSRFESLYKQIKDQKNQYFQQLEKAKDNNFNVKTELLRRLRELVEADENNAGDPKTSWSGFKQIQDEWKAAGNVSSPHNATLWATYHALVDRYYSNRNIYFELKELDRKRNQTLKTELCEKVEALVQANEGNPVTKAVIDEANALFEEYKHIGPAPKAEQEVLWQRFKKSLDTLYDRRRGQNEEIRREGAQLYEEKSKLYEELVPFTSFTSNSINDWNEKTREVMALQDRWNVIRGPMPRDEGKELSKKFWAALKQFFHHKGEFFKQLESKREQNLKAKTRLCEEVEAILESDEESAEATQKVIELQRQWKTIGQVPEKFKDSIFERFKAACDGFFNKKRSRNQAVEKEFEENLAKKISLCERIEAAATSENADLTLLNEFKKEWSQIGYVPKKDMQSIQKRYINAVNSFVGASGKISSREKERLTLENEAELIRETGSTRDLYKKEGDIRRRMTTLENDIAVYNNNIEFFSRSKGADKLRADIDKKIQAAQKQLDDLKHQLKVIREAQ